MIGARVTRGTLWSFADLAGGQAIGTVVFLLLARLIQPEDYGVFAIVLFFFGLSNVLLVTGLPEALVQRYEIDEDHRSTAFWANLILAAVLAAILIGISESVANFYQAPVLASVMRWMSVCCILSAGSTIHLAVLRRDIKMAIFPARTLAGYSLGGVIAVAMAIKGSGVWALVGNQIGIWGISMVVVWWFSPWHPRLRFSAKALKDLTSYSFFNIASNLVVGTENRIDSLIVGAFFTSEYVGYYALGQRIMHALNMAIISPIGYISLAVLSGEAYDKQRFNRTYANLLLAANVFWVPACLGFGFVASDAVPAIFGTKWEMAIPVIQMLSLTAFTAAFSDFTIYALGALGKPHWMTVLSLFQMAVTAVVCVVGAQFSVVAVAFGWSLMLAIMAPVHVLTVRKVSGVQVHEFLPKYLKIAASAILMYVGVYLVRRTIPHSNISFVLETAAGMLVYLGAMAVVAFDYLTFLTTRLLRATRGAYPTLN